MKRYRSKISCPTVFPQSKRRKDFFMLKYELNYESDKGDRNLIKTLVKKGKALAKAVHPAQANKSASLRSWKTIENNSISGLLAEYLWVDSLRAFDLECQTNNYEKAIHQIDITLKHNQKKIEVRSSFPKNGVKFALCHPQHEFDILGPYSNSYKPGEIKKDFYVRTLFPYPSFQFLQHLEKDGFIACLTGGATWGMMMDKEISKQKDLIPQDDILELSLQKSSTYQVVPISRALDTFEMLELFKKP